jgi:hypothetical protein
METTPRRTVNDGARTTIVEPFLLMDDKENFSLEKTHLERVRRK